MPPSSLSTPHQPPWIRFPLKVFESLASLKLAVFVIFGTAAALAWATVYVERIYGDKGVQFAVYGTWWFAGLLALLGLNVFCAAAIRFPWKRYQTGFAITHLGISVLLFGCLLTGAAAASMPSCRSTKGPWRHWAFEDEAHIDLEISRTAAGSEEKPDLVRLPFLRRAVQLGRLQHPLAAIFAADEPHRLVWFPWQLAAAIGACYTRRTASSWEVLDYLGDSEADRTGRRRRGLSGIAARPAGAGEPETAARPR